MSKKIAYGALCAKDWIGAKGPHALAILAGAVLTAAIGLLGFSEVGLERARLA